MRQIQLVLPTAVGGGTVISQRDPAGGVIFPGPTIDNVNPYPSTVFGPRAVGETVEPGGNGGINPPMTLPTTKNKKSEEPATGINLSGYFESWGVSSSQNIETARIEFSGLTAQQIKQILQRIPSTFKATLEIAYKEGGES
jgi:hypothetical protein